MVIRWHNNSAGTGICTGIGICIAGGYDGGHSGDSDENPNKLGSYWTAVSVINDSPIKKNGKNWPKNWYHGYKGEMSLRTAVEQSVNTVAVKICRRAWWHEAVWAYLPCTQSGIRCRT